MNKIYSFICWICCFTKRLKSWISSFGCRAELIATATESAQDHGDNFCDAKGLSGAPPTRMNFSWSRRSKSTQEQVIAVTCFPPSFKGEGSALAEEWAAHRLHGSSCCTLVPPGAWIQDVGKRKKPSHNCLSRYKTDVLPLSEARSGFSLSHSQLDVGVHRWISGFLSLQQHPANSWVLLWHPTCCSASFHHLPLSQSIFLHEKKVYFLSRGVYPTFTLAELEGWGLVSGNSICDVSIPNLTKNSQFISFAATNSLCKH